MKKKIEEIIIINYNTKNKHRQKSLIQPTLKNLNMIKNFSQN